MDRFLLKDLGPFLAKRPIFFGAGKLVKALAMCLAPTRCRSQDLRSLILHILQSSLVFSTSQNIQMSMIRDALLSSSNSSFRTFDEMNSLKSLTNIAIQTKDAY